MSKIAQDAIFYVRFASKYRIFFIEQEYFLTVDRPGMIEKWTKKLLQFTPQRKTEWKLSYEELILKVNVKNLQKGVIF